MTTQTMAKTAEQFIDECDPETNDPSYVFAPSAVKAAREFAAQEVEEYKERLKSVLLERFPNMIWLPREVNSIIDTTK